VGGVEPEVLPLRPGHPQQRIAEFRELPDREGLRVLVLRLDQVDLRVDPRLPEGGVEQQVRAPRLRDEGVGDIAAEVRGARLGDPLGDLVEELLDLGARPGLDPFAPRLDLPLELLADLQAPRDLVDGVAPVDLEGVELQAVAVELNPGEILRAAGRIRFAAGPRAVGAQKVWYVFGSGASFLRMNSPSASPTMAYSLCRLEMSDIWK
jgi:hypothetical protein